MADTKPAVSGAAPPAPTPFTPHFGRPHVLTLPISGYKIRVRRPSLFTLVTAGAFPDDLAATVWTMSKRGFQLSNNGGPEGETDPQKFGEFARVIEVYIPHVLVDPKASAASDVRLDAEGCLTGLLDVAELDDVDKQRLFFFGQGIMLSDDEMVEKVARISAAAQEVTSADVRPFRDGAARGDGGPGGEALRPAAFDAAGYPVREPGGD